MQEITTLANIQCVPCMKDLFHRVVAVPSAVFFRTLSVPIWAPYIWYQNVNRRQDVGGILGLWKQATSPFSAGADASKNKYLPVHEKGQQEWISFEKFDGGAPAHDRGAPASVALFFHRWKKMGEETEERENDRIIETLRRSIRTFGQPLKQVNCWRSVWSNSRLPEHSGVQIPTQAQFLY